MEISMTKMSQNGQIVIPLEIRKAAKIEPFTKFVIFNNGSNIILERLDEKELIKRVKESEQQIKNGQCIKANTDMSFEEFDDLLMNK